MTAKRQPVAAQPLTAHFQPGWPLTLVCIDHRTVLLDGWHIELTPDALKPFLGKRLECLANNSLTPLVVRKLVKVHQDEPQGPIHFTAQNDDGSVVHLRVVVRK